MTKVLLSCNSDTYNNAADLRDNIEKHLGFKVALDVESDDPVQSDDSEADIQQELTEAAVLFAFKFGEEFISAWVMIEDSDKRCGGITYKEPPFPEIINFSKSINRGIRIFRYIMVNEFGLVMPTSERERESTIEHKEEDQPSTNNDQQAIKDQPPTSRNRPKLLEKIGKLFSSKSRRQQLSQ